MDRDEALKRIEALTARAAEQQLELPELPKAPSRRRRRARMAAASRAPRAWRHALPLDDLLERFTPAEAFAFVYERTVPPANEDGLALLEAYPELRAAAPELVDDMAVAFRTKERHEYAAHFERVAMHHGLSGSNSACASE